MAATRAAPRSGLSARETYAYAAGEFGSNLTWNMYSGFILFYYTNTVLLPVAAVGTLLLLTRILDSVIDPLIGVAVDRTRTRFGRARPWLIGSAVPFMLVTALSFSVPDWSMHAKLIYAYLTFMLAGILFSAIYIPYSSLLPLMKSDPNDKLRIGGLRAMAASAGSIVIYGVMLHAVLLLGQGSAQRGYTLTSTLMGAFTALGMLLVFSQCREREFVQQTKTHEKISAGFADMIRNPVWLIVTGFALAMFIRLGALVSLTPYFASEVMRAPWAIGVMLSSLSISLLLGGFISRPFLAHFGKRRGNLLALLASLALTLVMLVSQSNVWAFGTLYFLGNITLGVQSTTIFVMIADAVDTQERLFGSRHEGLLTSSVSFATKVGMAIGGALTAYGLALASYDPKLVTDAARDRISLLYFVGPAVFAILQMAVIACYRTERQDAAADLQSLKEAVL
jgi:GPH family glycoside/pentoside/hexuronide:cation symporter